MIYWQVRQVLIGGGGRALDFSLSVYSYICMVIPKMSNIKSLLQEKCP